MPRDPNPTPSYIRHRQSGRARASWTDATGQRHERLLPGLFKSKESKAAYDQLVVELKTSPNAFDGTAMTVSELILAYILFAQGQYKGDDGEPTDELRHIKGALRPARELYAAVPAEQFGPLCLRAVRQKFVEAGHSRKTVNAYTNRVRRMFRWAVSEELVKPAVFQGLAAVEGLRLGRTSAHDCAPVRPAVTKDVEAVLPRMPEAVRALARLQLHSAARAGELVRLRACDIDRTDPEVWTFAPATHKGTWKGRARVIYFGAKCREVLAPFILKAGNPEAFLFSPAQSEAERNAERSANRVVKLWPSHAARNERIKKGTRRKRGPRDRYTTASYRQAIERACDAAGVPRFTPHRLRHLAATLARAEFGVDVARALCGHSLAAVTEIYSGEVDRELAMKAARKLG